MRKVRMIKQARCSVDTLVLTHGARLYVRLGPNYAA